MKNDVKADYRATQYKQRSRLLKSKGLGWESHSLRDVRKILTHAFQKGWEVGVDVCLKEWDEEDMTDEVRAWEETGRSRLTYFRIEQRLWHT